MSRAALRRVGSGERMGYLMTSLALVDPETRIGLVSQGNSEPKPGTGSCIQSGQKPRDLTAGELENIPRAPL
ncbi:hypothetical protein H8959_014974 [Pygathrix nigripes]